MSVVVHSDRQQAGASGGRHPSSRSLLLVLGAIFVLAASGWCTAQETPAISFDAATQVVQSAPAEGQANNDTPPATALSFNFRFAPWEDVLVKFADVAGLTLDLTDVPPGTFNYYDKGQYSPREALGVLNGYLLQRGFVLVRRDRFLVCVNLEKGIPANLIPLTTLDQLAGYGDNEMVSVVIAHKQMDAALAASQIEQLQGPHGKAIAMSGGSSLLVTDTAGNLRLVNHLLEAGAFTARAVGGAGLAFKSFELSHVRADETERLIRRMFGLPPAFSASRSATGTAGSSDLSLTADARSNRLFVAATTAKLAAIEEMVAAFDVPRTTADSVRQGGATTTRILPLPNADVIIIGQALESLSPRIHVSTTHSTRGPAANAVELESVPANKLRGESPGRPRSPMPAPQHLEGRDN